MSKQRVFLFLVAILMIVSLNKPLASALTCDPNCIEPDFFVYGLCFSPYMDGQVAGSPVSEEQLQERLGIITQKVHTQWIRTYSATNGLEKIPADANNLGLNVAMGTWIRDNMEDEITNLVAAAQSGLVDIAVVGNEELYAEACTVEELINDVNDVRQRLTDAGCSIPIGIAEPFDTLFGMNARGECTLKHSDLIAAVDVVIVNIYPFHKGVHIDMAVQDLAQRYNCAVEAVADFDSNKVVIIGETGWPSDGLTKGDAEPSLSNITRYFSESNAWATENDVPLFYFAAFDEKWKEIPLTEFRIESHWGIWDSSGQLKHTFVREPMLCETFDPVSNYFCVWRHWDSEAPEPNVLPGDPNQEDHFLRLLYDGTGRTRYSSVAFERVAVGTYPRTVAEFDFRMDGPDVSDDADGFAFMLIPTLLNGTIGCSRYDDFGFFAEEPRLPKTFAIGFDVWQGHGPTDLICVSWDERWYPDARIDAPFELDSGNWHHVKIDLRSYNEGSALVAIELTRDIYNANDGPYSIEDIVIGDSEHPYKAYENRVEFVGRNEGLDINSDIDNIYVTYKSEVCDCELSADLNGDCVVNLIDFAIFALQWLQTCDPNEAETGECFPVAHVDYTNWITIGQPECWCCATQCYGDSNCDGVVNELDISPIVPLIGIVFPQAAYDPCLDFDHDLDVDTNDLNTATAWYEKILPTDCLTTT